MTRAKIVPILEAIPATRQADARHYGVHPYFTRRPPNVVRQYIERFSKPKDLVLDPFGGTGVTAIEAFLAGRRAIHNDLNPFANFIAQNIADTTLESVRPLQDAFHRVEDYCATGLQEIEQNDEAAKLWLQRLPLPENIVLPRSSDAERFYDLFTTRQLAGLALLKQAIDREAAAAVRNSLLLAWSASVAKLNKTFLSARGRAASRGGSSIFSIYRYKLAAECVELPIWDTFLGRFRNIIDAKEEVIKLRKYSVQHPRDAQLLDSHKNFRVLAQDAAELDCVVEPGTVDYIFTDPPYGAFISYLDLSILWNHWLGFPITHEVRSVETIVGGESNLTEAHYKDSLRRSIQTCLRLLKPDRWFSIVFQHWDLSYFATILESADEAGAELKTAVTQTGDVIWSMHKKKNSETVIAGEMIITFYKPSRRRERKSHATTLQRESPRATLSEVFDKCLADRNEIFTSEALFNRLVLELWHRRALNCLSLDRREFAQCLKDRGWSYDARKHIWHRGSISAPSNEPVLF